MTKGKKLTGKQKDTGTAFRHKKALLLYKGFAKFFSKLANFYI